MSRRGMRPWKRWLCRCGWHSESYRQRRDVVVGQCQVHRAQCQDCRDHGLTEEETAADKVGRLRDERDAARRRVDELEAVCDAHAQRIDWLTRRRADKRRAYRQLLDKYQRARARLPCEVQGDERARWWTKFQHVVVVRRHAEHLAEHPRDGQAVMRLLLHACYAQSPESSPWMEPAQHLAYTPPWSEARRKAERNQRSSTVARLRRERDALRAEVERLKIIEEEE